MLQPHQLQRVLQTSLSRQPGPTAAAAATGEAEAEVALALALYKGNCSKIEQVCTSLDALAGGRGREPGCGSATHEEEYRGAEARARSIDASNWNSGALLSVRNARNTFECPEPKRTGVNSTAAHSSWALAYASGCKPVCHASLACDSPTQL